MCLDVLARFHVTLIDDQQDEELRVAMAIGQNASLERGTLFPSQKARTAVA